MAGNELSAAESNHVSFWERFTALEKRVAATVFRFHIPFLDQLNTNAQIGRWLRQNKNIPCFRHRNQMYDMIAHDVIREEPIDYIEFGVYRGASIKRWTTINIHPDSRFFGFDSFEGLPEYWTNVYKAGDLDVGGEFPKFQDSRVTFVKGWFQDTLPVFMKSFQPRSRLVVHHDSDLYTSVLYCLTMMNEITLPGTILMFDEFSSPMHEYRALMDYTQSYRRTVKPLAITAQYAQQAAFIVE